MVAYRRRYEYNITPQKMYLSEESASCPKTIFYSSNVLFKMWLKVGSGKDII